MSKTLRAAPAHLGWPRLIAVVTTIAALHVAVYYLVLSINAQRPPAAFVDLTTAVDGLIPYVGWTWVFYYFAEIYVTLWAGYVFWHIPHARVGRAVLAYGGMILVGGLVQIALPAAAPWPHTLVRPQQWMHASLSLRPYACLPSMHVALTVLPAAIALSVLSSRWLKLASTVCAVLIAVSTVTLKEHYVLDVVAGLMLGLAAYGYWRGKGPRARQHATA